MTRKRAIMSALALTVFAALAAGTIYVHIRAARLVSGALTGIFGAPVSVGMVDYGLTTGINLYFVKISNPPGYKKPYLLELKSVNVTPDYRELLRGNRVVYSLQVYAPSLDLEKGPAGAWNYQPTLDHIMALPPSRFTVGSLTVRSGRISLPGYGYELTVPEIKTTAISNITREPIGFEFSVGDGKGLSVTADGKAEVFGETQALNADVSVEGENIGSYISPPEGVDLEHATAKARVGAEFKDGALVAAIDIGVNGIKSSYYKGKGWLDARLSGSARYDLKADSITLKDAVLDVPGVTRLEASGTVADLKGAAAVDFTVIPSPVELARLGPYLPAGVELSGRLLPEHVNIKGTLKPVKLSADGRAKVSAVSAGFAALGGAAVKGVGGTLSFRLTPDGRLDAGADLDAIGGKVIGGVRYAGESTEFRLGAGGLDVSGLGGSLAGLTGRVTCKVEGVLKGRGVGSTLKANYKVEASDAAYKDLGGIGSVTVEGDAAGAGKSLRASGSIAAAGGTYKDYSITRVEAGYGYADGTLTISALSAKAKDLSAGADTVKLRYAENKAHIVLKGGAAAYRDDLKASGMDADAYVRLGEGNAVTGADGTYSIANLDGYGIDASGVSGTIGYDGKVAAVDVGAQVLGSRFTAKAGADVPDGKSLKNAWISAKVESAQLSSLAPLLAKYDLPVAIAGGTATFAASASGDSFDSIKGTATLDMDGLGLDRNGKPLLRGLSCSMKPNFTRDGVTLSDSVVSFGDSFKMNISGGVTLDKDSWSVTGNAKLKATDMLSLQEGVLEALPPTLKWADVSGSASADIGFTASKGGTANITGGMKLAGVLLDMPDKGIKLGPVDGSVPVVFSLGGGPPAKRPQAFRQEKFEREGYPALLKKYSARPQNVGLTIKKALYGFVELDDIAIGLAPGDGYYEIPWFAFSVLGAKSYGYGIADYGTGKPGRYAVSMLVDGFSLTELCNTVPGIKGYISGRVDGLTRVLVTGDSYRDVSGAGMFWAVEDKKEDREISKEFLKKLIGPSMKKFMYVGDRSYDTGELDIIFSDGDLVFDNLLLSHEYFFGYRDLHVTVAPVSNKISIEHLLEVIKDVKARAGG